MLSAFINEVDALRYRKIQGPDAETLEDIARWIIEAIED